MNNILSILNCCSTPFISESDDSIINHSSTKKITQRPNVNKLFENKLHIKQINNNKDNPFENNKETTASNELISPHFIKEGNDDKNSNLSNSSLNKDKLFSSLISFSNFPNQISPPIEKEDNGPKLLCSGELFFGKEIIITSKGMVNSVRNKTDCQTFFGLKNSTDYRGIFYNDFVINFKNDDENIDKSDSSTGRVFNIAFQKKTKEFNLYMISDSIIIYYEINDFVYFNNENDYYLLLGNIFITIITKKSNNNLKEINIEIEEEDTSNNSFSFTENDTPITIGRGNCKINIQKPSISKNHGVIEFSKECNMFYYKDCGSTNGSILLIKENDSLKIKGEMNFKLENIPFKIMELP
jgi:hypothetical protein